MIFFFYGPNSYASRRKLQEMAATYVKKTGSNLGIERIDGASATAGELIGALRAMPFLVTSRLVIIEYLSANKAAANEIEAIIKEVPQTTVAVFYEKEVDKRTNFFKVLSRQATVQNFEMLSPGQLSVWLHKLSKQLGVTIEPAAASELVNRAGDDQWRLEQEFVKLANFSSNIKRAEVVELVEPAPEDNIFNLVDAMTSGRTQAALAEYQKLLSGGANEIYILTMIIWQLRNLLLAKTAGSMAAGTLAKTAGLSPYVAQKAQARQANMSEIQIKEAFLAAVETEHQIKTGGGPARELLELLIYKVSRSITSR